jgi:hypothetical protein
VGWLGGTLGHANDAEGHAVKVAILGERFGVIRDAFLARGHDAVSCDLVDTLAPGPHIKGDWFDQDWSGFDLLIAHPTCTYLCNSGVRWLATRPGRMELMEQAARDFRRTLELPCDLIATENPIMHKYAVQIIGRRQDQIIQPWMFGHGETKATGLWLKGLPKLVPTNIVEGREGRIHKLPPSPDRAMLRSKTYSGIAEAMADQWGNAFG